MVAGRSLPRYLLCPGKPGDFLHAHDPRRYADLKSSSGRWLLYDASKFTLGRLAAQIAMNLMGKDRPTYTPGENSAFVVVVNAEKVRTTGRGRRESLRHYTGCSGRKEVSFARLPGNARTRSSAWR
jgi:ribosomal protein L13